MKMGPSKMEQGRALSYKAIARAAGYRVEYIYGDLNKWPSVYGFWYFWKDVSEATDMAEGKYPHREYYGTPEEAYKACCEDCGLLMENE